MLPDIIFKKNTKFSEKLLKKFFIKNFIIRLYKAKVIYKSTEINIIKKETLFMKLALFGGEKSVNKTAEEMAFPVVPESAYETIIGMLKAGEITSSPKVAEFEEKFAKYIGRKYGLCFCNGTSSIQSALFALGVGAGDEVIVPSFTFWATAGPVLACNAVPVFADVDLSLQTLSAENIAKVITPKTKAIVVVHTWGTPCDMEPIMTLAKKENIKVIEDCSHAHGAVYHGKKVGSFGDIACFSLQGSKVLAGGEAGIFVTDVEEYYEKGCALGHYDRLPNLSDDSFYKKFVGTGLGYKHRVHPIAVAIADAGLDVLDERNQIRNSFGKMLDTLLGDLEFLVPQKVPENAERVYAYNYMRYIPEKLKGLNFYVLCKALYAEGVACGTCGYGRLHKAPLYTDGGVFGNGCPISCPHYGSTYIPTPSLPNTELLAQNAIMIAPRFEAVTEDDIMQYSQAYHKVAENVDKLLEYQATLDPELLRPVSRIGYSNNFFSN